MKACYSYFKVLDLKIWLGLILLCATSSLVGQTLGLTLTNSPTGQVTPGTTITYTMVLSTSINDTNVVVTGHVPSGTSLVPGSAQHIGGLAPTSINGGVPSFTYATLGTAQTSTIRYQVVINNATQPGTITNNNTRVNSSGSSQRTAIAVSNIVVPALDNSQCVCLNDASLNMQNGSYAATLIIRHPLGGQTLNMGQTYTITSSSGIFTPDGNAGPGVTGAPIANGTTFLYCAGGGCAPGVAAGQYYLQVHIPNNGNFSFMVSTPGGGSLTRSVTTCNTYPALPVIPLMDRECLDTITQFASSGGVYSIFNLLEDPSEVVLYSGFQQMATGPLVINPDLVDPFNSPFPLYLRREVNGCAVVSFRDALEVYKSPQASLESVILNCRITGDLVPLSAMIGENGDSEGSWSVLEPHELDDDGDFIVVPDVASCYTVTFTADNPFNCPNGPFTDTKSLLIIPGNNPEFNIVGPTSPACQSGGNVTIQVVRTSTGSNPRVVISRGADTLFDVSMGANNALSFDLAAPADPGSIGYTICLEESNNPPSNCGDLDLTDVSLCENSRCIRYVIYNDGINCGDGLAFESQCPPNAESSVCPVITEPFPNWGCNRKPTNPVAFIWVSVINAVKQSILDLIGPYAKMVSANLSDHDDIIFCDSTTFTVRYTGTFLNIPGLSNFIASGNRKIRDLGFPFTQICRALEWEICFPLGIGCWRPLRPLANLVGCDETIAQFIFRIIAEFVGGDGGGGIVIADTDGDGAFDMVLEQYRFPASGTLTVPINVKTQSTNIVVRNVVGYPFKAESPLCGKVVTEDANILDMLPIGEIPIVGPPIAFALQALDCGIWIGWSDEKTIVIPVINNSLPIFANCPTTTVIISEDFTCDLEANWSIPMAFDGCTEEPLFFRGIVGGVDVQYYAGPPVTFTEPNQSGIYQTGGPVPGSDLPVGSYEITYTAYSCQAVPSTCTFTVSVTSGDPILECPASFTVGTDVDQCSAIVNGLAPYQGIGCASILNYEYINPISGNTVSTNSTIPGTHNVPDGAAFELGTTNVTYTMLVDIDGDGQYDSPGENQQCTFNVTVVDQQDPVAACIDVVVQLNNNGSATVFALDQFNGSVFINGGSLDNCTANPTIEISRPGEAFAPFVMFDCEDLGVNLVNLRVVDAGGNSRTCIAQVEVRDFFQNIQLQFNLPELCLEANNPVQLDFSNYLTITLPNGQVLRHQDLGQNAFMGSAQGAFGITGFFPHEGSASNDPGSISADGVYSPGQGTGYVVVSYVIALPGAVIPQNGNTEQEGCFIIVHGVFELRQPLDMVSPECVCGDGTERTVELGVITGGLEPYRIQYQGGTLDVFGDGTVIDVDGEYTYDTDNGHNIDDFAEYLGVLRIQYTQPTWSFTIVDARGCELFRSGSCDNDDLTVGPEIPTLPDTTIFTKFYFCESNLVWEHPLPWDNCAVVKYNFQINNPDGTVSGPFNLSALINQAPGAPIDSLFNASFDFELGTSVVLYYAEDAVGNFVTNQFLVTVIDDDPPYYINCPYPPIVQDAEFGQCDAYVTFSLPIAFDNCALPPSNMQIDNTGLTTGSRFPVGTTVLYWEAIDDFDNRDTCQVKVIVNDFGNYPNLTCPASVVVGNDPWLCSAVVDDIGPDFTAVCMNNMSITYSVFADEALTERKLCGVWDASGQVFDKGTSWVRYRIASQPLLLITEVSQSGAIDQIEITNLGPASMDITCLKIMRVAANPAADEVLGPIDNLPDLDPIILPVGEVMVFDFSFDGAANMPACYTISYMDVVIDQVAVNGFADCAGFTGTLNSGDVYRHCEDDSNDAADWAEATNCDGLTIGTLNPVLSVMPDNGTQTSLQSISPNRAFCVFTIEVEDREDPFCGQLEDNTTTYNAPGIPGIGMAVCNRSTLVITDECIIGEIDFNLTGTATPNNSTITLISPTGIEVLITEIPATNIEELYVQKSEGTWTLDIVPNPGQFPTVTGWSLTITCMEVYDQPDVVLNNDPGLCGASFTWTHPYFVDNCFEGTITVSYTSTDADCVPDGKQLDNVGGYEENEFFCVGTTTVTYTLVDAAGNTATCGFDVTVLDVEDPVITCPNNIFINLEPGLCRAIVCYVPAFTDDNCEVVDTIYNPPFCSEFEIGIHDVSITVVDEAGNEATCTFQVHIIEFIPQDKSLKCNDLVQVSLGLNCLTEIGADDILEGNNYRCYENYIVTVLSGAGGGMPPLPTSPFVTGSEVGKLLMVEVMDPDTGNKCWGLIQVEDKQPPIITCPAPAAVGCAVDPLPASTGTADVEDCSTVTLTYNDVYTEFGQCANPRAQIVREWRATDAGNNLATCQQIISVEGFDLAQVSYPADITLSCTDVPFPSAVTPQLAGAPSINGFPINGGLCSASLSYTDEVFDICPRSFEILRRWRVRNTCLPLGPNNPSEHYQLIAVLDQTPPVLFCPQVHDIKFGPTKPVGLKDCTVNVMLPWVQVTDNCTVTTGIKVSVYTILPDGSVITVNQTNPNGFFVFDLPVGSTYTFTYVAQDACGNFSECSVTLPIEDTTPPVTICETFHTVALTDSTTLVFAESFDDGSYDDCTPIVFDVRRGTMNAAGNFVQHPCNLPGDFLFRDKVSFYCCDGISTVPLFVELRVRDAFGNANSCMVEVEVVDKIRPVIWCPDDITVQCGMPFEPTEPDTFQICVQPNVVIKNAFAEKYPVTLDIFGIPADARITDVDLSLLIDHHVVNDLTITLYSPLGLKATVLTADACLPQNVPFGENIAVTFNDQAYDIAWFNQTGVRRPAEFTCTNVKPSIGAFNQGHMKPQADELKIFNGQPLNSFTSKDLCFTVSASDINVPTNRMSNFQVQQFIANAGLIAGDRILLEYASFTGSLIDGLSQGNIYLFQVINANTIELLTVTGDDIKAVVAGSTHMFCASGTWLLVVEDTKPLAGGLIREVCLSIGYAEPTALKPIATDNTEACGLDFSHQDLGTPDKCANNTFINRRWRVDDQFGNNSTCIQRVYFRDDTPLTVQFPCDITINCANLQDLNATGDVRHNGDCELVAVSHTDQMLVTTDACFKVLRTWTVIDWCKYQEDGNVDYPTTSINEALNQITFSTAINALINSRRIEIGDRVTLRYVTSGTTEIPGLIEGDIYSMVRISGTTFRVDYNTTKQQAVNITGQGVGPHIFRYTNSDRGLPITCDVLQEWYPFVEWYTACCNPVAARRAWEDDGDGYFKFTQEIKVVDNLAPQWVNCADVEYCSFEANCGPTFIDLKCLAVDACTDSAQLKYTYFIDAFNDGTIDIEGTGNDASGAYPLGTHKITFKVTDQCGNWNTCTKLFTIRDCKKPTPICINGLSVDLMATPNGGMAQIWAKSLEAGDSHDNCTSYENLTILVERFSAITPGQDTPGAGASDVITVTCDDIPPVATTPHVEVVVWVGDEAGNWDYCITTIWVQDNMGACGNGMTTALFTHIQTEYQEGVELVEVGVSGDYNMLQLSNSAGQTLFNDLMIGSAVTVAPSKDINPLNGISTYDLLLIQKHILSVKSLGSPYKLIAADVNNSTTVTISDIIELRRMILNPGLAFSNNTSWRFVDADFVFPNPHKISTYPEMKSFAGLPNGATASFVGVKIGDVSGDASPNSLLGGEVRDIVGVLPFSMDDQRLEAGRDYTIAIKADDFDQIQGYQYTIEFDTEALQMQQLEPVWSELGLSNFGLGRAGEGLIATSWNSSEGLSLRDGEVLYTISFRALTDVMLSQVIRVNSRMVRAEAYDRDEDLLDVRFRFDGGLLVGGEFALYQNEPNPFSDITMIGFNLPETTTATLKVYDTSGKILKVIRGEFARGYNEIQLSSADIRGQGMLFYELETSTHRDIKRMILVD
jgi:hypothetical protein